MNPDDLVDRVRAYIAKHQLLAPGERVLVAVSGGVDSMVLLHLLRILAYDVRVAHFDHETRNGESTRDAEFVADHCAAAAIPCMIAKWDDLSGPPWTGHSFEMDARKRRYAFFLKAAYRLQCDAVALGHQADDQAETVLFRALRGTGPEGLAGIAPVRLERGTRIVRPLLASMRSDIEAFARASTLEWRNDITNEDTTHQRNWIRHTLLGTIARDFNPRAASALVRLADSIRCENDLLDNLTQEAKARVIPDGNIQREGFRALHPALQRRLLRQSVMPGVTGNSHELVVAAVDFVCDASPGKQMSLDKKHNLFASHETVYLRHLAREGETAQLDVPGECVFEGRRFTLTLSDTAPAISLKAFCNKHRQVFDADVLGEAVAIFAGATANEFLPLGATRPKKLNEYLKDRQVPLPERLQMPIILAKDGVAWVVGHAPSALFAVTSETKRFAIIEVLPCD